MDAGEETKKKIFEPIGEAAEVADPIGRAKLQDDLVGWYQDAMTEASRGRKETILGLVDAGMSQSQIAERLGTSRQRIGQITKGGPPPERAFLGVGTVTVAIGEKPETVGDEKAVVAAETYEAYNRLAKLAKTLQLEADSVRVPPPGLVDLNRDNLIVMGGPRLFPLVGQILRGDPHLRFEEDPATKTWSLQDVDTGKIYRSPRDTGEPRDYAYLGRLPRPDGKGLFLLIAGLHAIATQGVVAYLETSVAELYGQVKKERFSMLIECEYDAATRMVTAAKPASPIYTARS